MTRLILPWPPRILSPNGRPRHWSHLHKAKKAQAKAASWAAISVGLHKVTVLDGALIRLHPIACPKTGKAYPDDDNLIASLKAARDALAQVLRVDDARMRWQEVQRGERCKSGAVIIDIEIAAP